MVKWLPAMWAISVQFLAWEDPLEKEMATHSSTLAWKIPCTEEPCKLQSMGSQRVGHDWATSLPFTGVYCTVLCLVAQLCLTLCDPMNCSPPGSSVHGDSPGLNPGLLHCRKILYHLSHHGSPRMLEWVAYSFSRGSSHPRNWTGVSCTSGGFFTSWTTRCILLWY